MRAGPSVSLNYGVDRRHFSRGRAGEPLRRWAFSEICGPLLPASDGLLLLFMDTLSRSNAAARQRRCASFIRAAAGCPDRRGPGDFVTFTSFLSRIRMHLIGSFDSFYSPQICIGGRAGPRHRFSFNSYRAIFIIYAGDSGEPPRSRWNAGILEKGHKVRAGAPSRGEICCHCLAVTKPD